MVNPKLLLIVGGVVLVVASAIAIFLAVSYTPQTATTPTTAPTTSAR